MKLPLTIKQRQVILLRLFLGWEWKDIKKKLGYHSAEEVRMVFEGASHEFVRLFGNFDEAAKNLAHQWKREDTLKGKTILQHHKELRDKIVKQRRTK